MFLARFLHLLSGCLLATTVAAQGNITVLLDSAYLLIGDPVRCTVVVNVPKGASSVTAPIIGDVIASANEVLEVLEQDEPLQEANQRYDTYQYPLVVTAWEPGRQVLPPLTFSFVWQDSIYNLTAAEVTLTAIAPQVTGDSTYVADITPILAERPTLWDRLKEFLSHPIVAVLLFLVVALVIVYFFLRYRNQQNQQPQTTPEEWAMARWAALRDSDFIQKGNFIAFHTEVSYILRAYLKRRFKIDALERPNSEFLPQLNPHPLLVQAPLRTEFTTVLQQADLIKYAKASPLPIANDKALELIPDLIKTVQERLEILQNEAALSSTAKTTRR